MYYEKFNAVQLREMHKQPENFELSIYAKDIHEIAENMTAKAGTHYAWRGVVWNLIQPGEHKQEILTDCVSVLSHMVYVYPNAGPCIEVEYANNEVHEISPGFAWLINTGAYRTIRNKCDKEILELIFQIYPDTLIDAVRSTYGTEYLTGLGITKDVNLVRP